jgi:tetratricopeptide (TPR) repeat protein
MPLLRSARFALVLSIALAAIGVACNKSGDSVNSASASEGGGKLPVTTKSEEARQEFLQGRDLSERLLGQESLQHFDQAIAADPEFASAELARANNSPTAKEFFDHLKKAVTLADKTSEGEKLLILANEAGANGNTSKQRDYLEKLVAAYPRDERAQFNLGTFYFAQQEMDRAVEHLKKATELAPKYSPSYNLLGYAYRQQGNYSDAEQAFKGYINLIPNDPNSYDSYAELLLKMGRFDDSLTQYHKSLSIDPHFVPSHFGIAADEMYLGKPEEANAELQKMASEARNDGELRTAFFGMAVVAADTGHLDKALQAVDRQYAIAEKKNDVAAMAGDLRMKGNILIEMSKYNEAQQQFDRSVQMIEGSDLSQEIKDNAELQHQFDSAAVAIGKKDFATAKNLAEQFRQGAEASKNENQVRLAHEIAGRLALAQKDHDKAIAELEQASQQDPRNLYRLSQAYQGKGDSGEAHDYCVKAAEFNSLPALNYAYIRTKAQKQLTQVAKKG